MAAPVRFVGADMLLRGGPPGSRVIDLQVRQHEGSMWSQWQLSPEELAEVVATGGRVWVGMMYVPNPPPIAVSGHRDCCFPGETHTSTGDHVLLSAEQLDSIVDAARQGAQDDFAWVKEIRKLSSDPQMPGYVEGLRLNAGGVYAEVYADDQRVKAISLDLDAITYHAWEISRDTRQKVIRHPETLEVRFVRGSAAFASTLVRRDMETKS